MLQPATGFITCSVCNAAYESPTKLREHQTTAHRRGGSEAAPETTAMEAEPEEPEV
jgi:hypothetical protein